MAVMAPVPKTTKTLTEADMAAIEELVDKKLASFLEENKDMQETIKELKESLSRLQVAHQPPAVTSLTQEDNVSGEVVIVTVEKQKGTKLGITLSEGVDNMVTVAKVNKEGLVAGTELLEPGMEIFSINGIKMVGKSSTEAADILIKGEGTMSIIALKGVKSCSSSRLMVAELQKENEDTKLGLALGESADNGMTIVTSVAENSLASKTDLHPGMAVRTVNNVNCDGKHSTDVAKLLSEASGSVTIVAEDIIVR